MENIEQAQSQTAPSAPPQEDVPVTLTAKAIEMVKITREQEGIDPSHGLRVAVHAPVVWQSDRFRPRDGAISTFDATYWAPPGDPGRFWNVAAT